ncbi:MAG TPA: hypothetical protein DDW72_05215 [Afipia sp.]|nr:hypothetical protein [Afipia sp.]
MGILDEIFAAQNGGNMPFNGAFPSPLAQPKTYMDYSSGWPIEMEVPKPQFGEIPKSTNPPEFRGNGQVSPFSFAGPGSMNVDPASLAPKQQQAVAPAPAPAAAPTDVSSSNRPVGAPLSIAPPQAAPDVAAPAISAAAPEKSWLDNLRSKVNDNSNMLLAFAGGLAGGRSWGDGLSKGLAQGVAGGQLDTANNQKRMMQTSTYAALKQRGVSDADAMLAMQNPEALKSLLSRLWPTYTAQSAGKTVGSFNPATGKFEAQYTDPTFEKVGSGDTLFQTGGGVPGAGAGTAPRPVASGGPEKAPSGYEWVDPKDPSKGMRGVEGGPADKIPAEVAARLGLAQSFLGQLPEIRKRVADGEATGFFFGAMAAMNVGKAGELKRQIASGAESLLRNLTGAGMNKDEAANYVKRYELEPFDTSATVLSKLTQLERELRSVDNVVSKGRSGNLLSKTPSASDPIGLR